MNAIPKAIAMANPKHVAACVTTVAGLITSKFAFDAAANNMDDTDADDKIIPIKRPYFSLTEDNEEEEKDAEVVFENKEYEYTPEGKCMKIYALCEKEPEVCKAEYEACLQAIVDM